MFFVAFNINFHLIKVSFREFFLMFYSLKIVLFFLIENHCKFSVLWKIFLSDNFFSDHDTLKKTLIYRNQEINTRT